MVTWEVMRWGGGHMGGDEVGRWSHREVLRWGGGGGGHIGRC